MNDRFGDDLQVVSILPQRARQGQPVEDTDVWARRSATTVTLPRPVTPEQVSRPGFLLEQVEMDRGRAVIDRAVQDAIAREFGRLKRYDVVGSADAADYVLLVETSYTAEAAASSVTRVFT